MREITLLKDQRLNFVIEVAKFYETDDELTLVKAENSICKQRAEHSEKMYTLLKGNAFILIYYIEYILIFVRVYLENIFII